MKSIKLKVQGTFKAVEIIKGAVGVAPSGMNLAQMRSRIRVLDAIDGLKEGADVLSLEDADYTTLSDAINSQPWAVAHRDLLAVIDAILTPLAVGGGTKKAAE